MKILSGQRKLYLLAAAVLALSVALCLAGVLGKRTAAPAAAAPDTPTGATASVPVVPAKTVDTTVYYQDNYGYLVPVVRAIDEQEGVAKATLALMVSSPLTDMEAARLGLRTVIPEGTEIDLDISGGAARINLTGNVSALPDAQSEANMVSAIVQTLTEFDTVDTVSFLINGQRVARLPHGTDVSGVFSRGYVNLESADAGLPPQEAETVMLYFPGESGSLIVPVTRMVYGSSDLNTAVLELVKGPSAQSPLDGALPSGCGLIDVTEKDGVVTVNFTREFIRIAEETDGGRLALKALTLTCAQFPGVKRVEIQVEGEPYDPGAATLALPSAINDEDDLIAQYLSAQAGMILGQED